MSNNLVMAPTHHELHQSSRLHRFCNYPFNTKVADIFIVALCIIAITTLFGCVIYNHSEKLSQTKVDETTAPPLKRQLAVVVRLPDSIVPSTYDLDIVPILHSEGNLTFHGKVKITFNVTRRIRQIKVHAENLHIQQTETTVNEIDANIFRLIPMSIARQFYDHNGSFWTVDVDNNLKPNGVYEINLRWIGILTENLYGFYYSKYVEKNSTKYIAVTTFKPNGARKAFPCFDEPALKAKFRINIGRPANMTSISNMNLNVTESDLEGFPGYVLDRYHETPPMSTYLVSFVVGDFDVVSSERVRIFTRRDVINQTKYALEIAPKILGFFERYFGIKYPLPKLDLIALPDSACNAMGNWGAVTFRESHLLYDDNFTNAYDKQCIATTISYEIAYQWFGNLVTPKWWSDLWLSEGFASYVQYFGVDHVEPTWKIMDYVVLQHTMNVLQDDIMDSSPAVRQKADHLDGIFEMFNSITYSKSASLIRMMESFLTIQVFSKGVTEFLNKYAYSNANQEDLWPVLTQQAHNATTLNKDLTVKDIMESWVLKNGYPFVTMTRDLKDKSILILQEECRLVTKFKNSSSNKNLWWIPVTWTSAVLPNFNDTQPEAWISNIETHIKLSNVQINARHWILFNVGMTGYYRVNYQRDIWRLLIKQLNSSNFEIIPPINRAQLLSDAFNLAKLERLDYATALELAEYIFKERAFGPWNVFFTEMQNLNHLLDGFVGYQYFHRYMLKQIKGLYAALGFEENPNESYLQRQLRVDLINMACRIGHMECVNKSLQLFEAWQNSAHHDAVKSIPKDFRPVVYCTVIRYGGWKEWNFLFDRYTKINVATEKQVLLQALGCSRDTWILAHYLAKTLDPNDNDIRIQDIPTVFESLAKNPIGRDMAFNYVINNWKKLNDLVSSPISLAAIFDHSTKALNHKYQLEELADFAVREKNNLGSAYMWVKRSIEVLTTHYEWKKIHFDTVMWWFKRNVH